MTAATATAEDIRSIGDWNTNAELLADVASLGWITDDMSVLDATYGHGRFWTKYRPPNLLGVDLNADKSMDGPQDFRALPYSDGTFDVVVFDPPYRLNGTPDQDYDEAFGIDTVAGWRDRMALICEGAAECARVASKHLLVKCQDQVVSGQMRWQTDAVTEVVTARGFRKADRFDFGSSGGRPQPPGRRQVHARHSASQLLIFTRGRVDNGVPEHLRAPP